MNDEAQLQNIEHQEAENANTTETENPIFRIVGFARLLELLVEKKQVLVRPRLWEDPFENYAFKVNYDLNGEQVSLGWESSIYAQCWSSESDSDALWRIYSPDKVGIQIKSTREKVLESLKKTPASLTCDPKSPTNLYAMDVKYLDEKDIHQRVQSLINKLDFGNRPWLEALALKRRSFHHEKEVRFVIELDAPPGKTNDWFEDQADLLHIPCEPETFIEELVLDPRMPLHHQAMLVQTIVKLGYNFPILKSKLYQPPNSKKKLSITSL